MILLQSTFLSRLMARVPTFPFFRARKATRTLSMALPKGRKEIFPSGHDGMTVRGVKGQVWVTADGESVDAVLRPGETVRVGKSRRVIFDAVEDCAFEMVF